MLHGQCLSFRSTASRASGTSSGRSRSPAPDTSSSRCARSAIPRNQALILVYQDPGPSPAYGFLVDGQRPASSRSPLLHSCAPADRGAPGPDGPAALESAAIGTHWNVHGGGG